MEFSLPAGIQRILWLGYPDYVLEFVTAAVQQLKELNLPAEQWTQAQWPPSVLLRDPKILFIISNGLRIQQLPVHFIIHQIEQCSSKSLLQPNSAYTQALRKALYVWDYSQLNIRTLTSRLHLPKVGLLEFGYHKSLEFPKETLISKSDILFLGARTERRNRILSEFSRAGLSVRVESKLFGANKAAAIQGAKIVLNLHYYTNPSILETERLMLLLANKKCIVSETSSDAELDSSYCQGVVFESTAHGLIARCKEILANPELRQSLETQAYEWFSTSKPLHRVWENLDKLKESFTQ